jgi:hypothetical protein
MLFFAASFILPTYDTISRCTCIGISVSLFYLLPKAIHVGFVVDAVAQGHVLHFFLNSHFTNASVPHLPSRAGTIGHCVATVLGDSVSSHPKKEE